MCNALPGILKTLNSYRRHGGHVQAALRVCRSCYRLTNLHTVRHLSLGHDRVAHLLLSDGLEALEAVRDTERGLRSVK